jgi:hypothetical protein
LARQQAFEGRRSNRGRCHGPEEVETTELKSPALENRQGQGTRKPAAVTGVDVWKYWYTAMCPPPEAIQSVGHPPAWIPSNLERALRAIGAPLEVLGIEDEAAREIYGYDLLLVRPDLHMVWRGNQIPEDAGALAAVATGREK